MTPLFIQRLLAGVFLGLGGWALLFPNTVERLVLAPDHYIGTPAPMCFWHVSAHRRFWLGWLFGFQGFNQLRFWFSESPGPCLSLCLTSISSSWLRCLPGG